MPPTKTPPTEPGLYRWHDGRGYSEIRYVSYVGEGLRYRMIGRENFFVLAKTAIEGYWERIDLGEPYIAPEPPVVELWTDEDDQWIVKLCDWGVICGDTTTRTRYWLWVEKNFNGIRKVGNLVLEEA